MTSIKQREIGDLAREPAVERTLPVLVVILLAFAFRAYHLDFQSLWGDEGISLLRAGLPFADMMRSLPREHVPGYWVLLQAWLSAAGTTDFALRYLSLMPSVLTVAIAYRLAVDLGSRRAGLVSALVLATSAFQVWYAQEARMYSWLVAVGMGSTLLLWRLLKSRRPVPLLVAYVLLVSAAINLHFYGFLIPLAHSVFALLWLLRTRNWRAFLRWAGAGCVVLLLYLPWYPRLFGASEFQGCCPALAPGLLPWRFFTAYTVSDMMPAGLIDGLPWVYLILVLIGMWAWFRRDLLGCLLLCCAAFVPLAAAFLIALITRDFYHERYAIYLSVPLVMLAGGSFTAVGPRVLGFRKQSGQEANARSGLRLLLGSLVLACLVGANLAALWRLYTDPTVQKADFHDIVRRIEEFEMPGDVILVHGLDPREVFLHYYRGDLPVTNLQPLLTKGDAEVNAALAKITGGAKRVWMLHYDPPTTAVEYWMASHGWLADRAKYGNENLTLSVYGLPALAQRELQQQVAFGPQLRLARAVIAGGASDGLSFRAGDVLGVTTIWDVLGPPPSLDFSLRLRDSQGRAWLASDYVPLEGSAPTQSWSPGSHVEDRRGLLLPPDLPPGTYEVFLELYDPATGVPVKVGEQDGATIASIQMSAAASAPDPAALPIARRVNKQLGDQIELLGFDISPQPLKPDQDATLTLWWRLPDRPIQPARLFVRADAGTDAVALDATYPLSESPADALQAGEILREFYPLHLDPASASGVYRISLALDTPDGLPVGAPLIVGKVALKARDRVYRLPRISHPLQVSLGDSIVLRGYDLSRPTSAGGEVGLTLYWQARDRVPGDYKVFVHLVDDGGRTVAQADSVPAEGAAPSESWLPGEVVVDSHALTAPGPGHYRVLVGLYDPGSGERLPATDPEGKAIAENSIPLGDVQLP